MQKKFNYYFFIGTTAELIKVLPIMMEFEKENIDYEIIVSGQNNILSSELFRFIKKRPEIILSNEKINQSALSLLVWFIKTLFISFFILNKLPKNKHSIMLVHGDTISTVMGALLGKILGMKIAHVEAGLRSYNFFHPFPEEIDRIIVSYLADIHLCPNKWAIDNLKNQNGIKVDTKNNTLIDSLSIALNIKLNSKLLDMLQYKKYFIFILHRQENLANKELVRSHIEEIINLSGQIECLFMLHEPTKKTLIEMHLLRDLENKTGIFLISRLPYFEFIHILLHAEFIITDGGSNQEECYYMGKPCLILRKKTERIEGLNGNVLMSNLLPSAIIDFSKNYLKYKKSRLIVEKSPSQIITKSLIKIKI